MLEKSYFENQRDVLLNNFSEFLLESTLVKSLSFVNHLSFRRKLPYHFKKEDLKIFETVLSEKYEKFVVEDSEFQVLLEDPSIERLADLLEYLCCSSCNSPLKR